MIAILTEEDKGNFRFKDTYEKLVNEYIETSNEDHALRNHQKKHLQTYIVYNSQIQLS